jgi:hypothetical protein
LNGLAFPGLFRGARHAKVARFPGSGIAGRGRCRRGPDMAFTGVIGVAGGNRPEG